MTVEVVHRTGEGHHGLRVAMITEPQGDHGGEIHVATVVAHHAHQGIVAVTVPCAGHNVATGNRFVKTQSGSTNPQYSFCCAAHYLGKFFF